MKLKIALFVLPAVFWSCQKNKLGGGSVIKGTVVHHSRFIANARVFIKFNATEFPGTDTTKYDAVVSADAAGNYNISCYQGSYFIYGFGYDDQIQKAVKGGIPVKLRYNETKSLDLPITED